MREVRWVAVVVALGPIGRCCCCLLLFVRVLRRFQQYFSHITTVSACDRELSVHFYSAASLKYHAPDT